MRLLFRSQMRARIDIAVAGAVLERDAPLPPRLARGCTREGRGIALAFARHRDRAVAGEPVVPFGIAGVERAFDEQAAKARAVDEEVAFDDAAVVARSGGRRGGKEWVSTCGL